MRALRRPAAGLLLAAGIIGAGIAIDAPSGHAANNTSLAVSPGRGSPDAPFTVIYRWPSTNLRKRSGGHACMPGQIAFEWDGSLLGRAASTPAGDGCVAVLQAAPPPGAYRGASAHTIGVTNDRSARATYTVIERATGAETSATPDSTTDPPIDPQATGLAGVPATPPGAASPTALAGGQQGGDGGVTGWLIAFGVLLFLAGAGTFGLVAWRARHPKPDADAPWSPADTDTQSLSLRDRGAWRAVHRADRRLD
jgi:hypothetical protein